MDQTLALARNEIKKYRLDTDWVLEPELPSFEIRFSQGKGLIAAPDPLELLYGVYDFAERFGGYFFFEPGRDRFDPERKTKPSDGIAVRARKPLLKRRGFIQEFPFNDETPDLFDWMAKNKLNYLLVWMKYYDRLPDELKKAAAVRGIEIESGHHNFDYWIPGAKYGKTHPEFFAEIDGKRIDPSGGKSALLLSEQLCTTNPALRTEIVKNMVEYCGSHPEIKTISLVPNDGFGWCECKQCSAFYDKSKKGDLYSLSEHVYKADRIYHDMVRDIAGQLRKKRPDLTVTFCAYVNYCAPSEGFTLENGMAVHMAPYWRCINHTIDDPDCQINSRYADDLRKWASCKRGGEVNVYEYFMGVNLYLSLPMIHFRELFHEMKWYADNRIDGILTQFHIPHWTVYGMNYVLMGKAARGDDADESIRTLFLRLFGKDAAEAEQFHRQVKALVMSAGHCHIPYPYSLLNRTKIDNYEKLEKSAKKLLSKKPDDPFRAELVIWTEYLCRFKRLFDKYHEGKLQEKDVRGFLDWIHSHRNTRIFVHDKFDMYFEALFTALRNKTEWLHFNLDWEDGYIRKHREILG